MGNGSRATYPQNTHSEGIFAGVVQNSVWLLGSSLSVRLLSLARNIILTRLLLPADFGLFALANTIVGMTAVLGGVGIGQSILYERQESAAYRNTAFWLNSVFAAMVFLIVVAVAPFLRTIYANRDLFPVLAVLGAFASLQIMSTVHRNLLRRELRLRALAIIDGTVGVAGFFCALVLAWIKWGAWALVWATFIASFAGAILPIFSTGWLPRPSFSFRALQQIVAFSGWYIAAALVSYLALGLDRMLIGRYLGLSQLGYYALAYDVSLVLSSLITTPFREAMIPALVRLRGSADQFWRAYASASRFAAIIVAPMLVMLVAAAPFALPIVFGSSWKPAVIPFQLLVVFMLGRGVLGDPFVPLGRFDLSLKMGVFLLAFSLSAVAFGLRYGIVGVAIAVAFGGVASYVTALYIAGSRDSLVIVIRNIRPYLLAATCGLLATFLLQRLLSSVLVNLGAQIVPVLGILVAYMIAFRWDLISAYNVIAGHKAAEVGVLPRRSL